jgi:hypothetical protein
MRQGSALRVWVPEWANSSDVRCLDNDKPIDLKWDGRYALAGARAAGDHVTIRFPIAERVERQTINGQSFAFTRKGNDVVHVEPAGAVAPLYQRERYRHGEAQWRPTERFLADRQLGW